MKFIVDAQLPPALATWLREKGHDAVAVREIGLREADDRTIWLQAGSQGAIVVTKDEDFARLASATSSGPAVLWVRAGNLVNRLLLARFDASWLEILEHFESGARIVELR